MAYRNHDFSITFQFGSPTYRVVTIFEIFFFVIFLGERKLISFFFYNFWGLGMRVEALILESQHADRGPAQVSREFFFFLFHAPPFRICPAEPREIYSWVYCACVCV